MSNQKLNQDEEFPAGATAPLPPRANDEPHPHAAQKARRGGRPGNRNAEKHGLHRLKAAVSELGARTIDKRTTVGRALAAWRADLVADLGGIDAISTQERALVEEAVKTKLLLDSVDAWLLSQGSLINKRTRAVVPAVRDRNALVATLRQLLNDLGLKRRAEEALDLGSYLARRARKAAEQLEEGHDSEDDLSISVASFDASGPLRGNEAAV